MLVGIGAWRLGEGGHNGQLVSNKGPARMGIRHHGQGLTIPSKGFFPSILKHISYVFKTYIVCALDKKKLLVQVRNKPLSRDWIHAFILGSPVHMVANISVP